MAQRLQLYGGAQDGQIKKMATTAHPKIFYAISAQSEEIIRATSGIKAKAAIRDDLSTMAYSYWDTVTREGVGIEFQYVRTPEHDLSPVVPGADAEKG